MVRQLLNIFYNIYTFTDFSEKVFIPTFIIFAISNTFYNHLEKTGKRVQYLRGANPGADTKRTLDLAGNAGLLF
jgi:hypothetical protein